MLQMEHFTDAERAALAAKAAEIPALIRGMIRTVPTLARPVIPAGGGYEGIWQEHNQDAYFLAEMFPEAAWGSMEIFMEFRMRNGLMPYCVRFHPLKIGFSQLQIVWPFARCALEIAKKLGLGTEELKRIYDSAAMFDRWLAKNRDHTGTGLVEMFCEYDTGHDRSLRTTAGGLERQCPGQYAGNMPDLPCMPLIAADLSAARYGALTALAELAERLDKPAEARKWLELADRVRESIYEQLYDPEDEFFYDRAPRGWRKFRTEHITRMFLNRVVDPDLFDRIYHRYFENEEEFLTPWPFPAVSVADPAFEPEPLENCWGRNTQALTLVRCLLWMDHYGRGGDLEKLMSRILRHHLDHPENRFTQELDPFTGAVIRPRSGEYMPAMIFFYESCRRLGILEAK